MGNPLRNTNIGQNGIQQMGGMFNQFRQNPMQWLMQRRVNIPQEYQNNPQQAVQYLLNNGQMSQDQFNKLSQMTQQMGIKL